MRCRLWGQNSCRWWVPVDAVVKSILISSGGLFVFALGGSSVCSSAYMETFTETDLLLTFKPGVFCIHGLGERWQVQSSHDYSSCPDTEERMRRPGKKNKKEMCLRLSLLKAYYCRLQTMNGRPAGEMCARSFVLIAPTPSRLPTVSPSNTLDRVLGIDTVHVYTWHGEHLRSTYWGWYVLVQGTCWMLLSRQGTLRDTYNTLVFL